MVGNGTRPLILAVDDDYSMRETLRELLSYLGYDVLTARHPDEALSIIQQQLVAPDVILSDIMMGEVSGFDFLQMLRSQPRYEHIPFLFMSGRSDHGEETQHGDLVRFIHKPFEVAQLLQALNELRHVPLKDELSVTYEIEGHAADPDTLAHILQDDMLVAAMRRMAQMAQQDLTVRACPVHHKPLEIVISLSSQYGLQTRIRACCSPVEKSTTRLLTDTLRDTAPFYTDMYLSLFLPGADVTLVYDMNAIDDWLMGRSDELSASQPEIDLRPYGASEAGISRQHARLCWLYGTLHIVDKGSANGTFVNGQRLEPERPYILRHGDHIKLASMRLEVAFQRQPATTSTSS